MFDKNQRKNERNKATLLLMLLSAGYSPESTPAKYIYGYRGPQYVPVDSMGKCRQYLGLDILFFLHGKTDKHSGKAWDRENDRAYFVQKFA